MCSSSVAAAELAEWPDVPCLSSTEQTFASAFVRLLLPRAAGELKFTSGLRCERQSAYRADCVGVINTMSNTTLSLSKHETMIQRLKTGMSRDHIVSTEKTTPSKRSAWLPARVRRLSDAELRDSAGRIVDLLQQLVIARPEMVLPVEQIMRGVLANFFVHLEDQERWRHKEMRLGRRTPLPQMPLSELPALKALLEATLPTPPDRASSKTMKSMSRTAVSTGRVIARRSLNPP